MIRSFAAAALALLALAAPVAAADTRSPPRSAEVMRLSFAPIVKKAAPAVVNVYSRRTVHAQSPFMNDPFFQRFFGSNSPFGMPRERVQNSLGSGVILGADGLIVTNHHVIADADQITVVLNDRREFEAKILLSDERADLAVLKIDTHGEKLPTLNLGDSDQVEVGDIVLAIGDPFGVGQTVTSGIVSGLARTAVGVADFRSFIQTDAAINPGNSGGALVDLDGDLVGINTAIFSQSGGSVGIGFAIPSAMVRIILAAANNGGKIVRPWLGASGQRVTAEIAEGLGLSHPSGVLVKDVAAGSPAAKAGIKTSDVILQIDGHDVEDPEGLRFRIATSPLDKPLQMALWRAHENRTVSVTLAAPPEEPARQPAELTGREPFAGATVANLNPAYDDELGFDPTQRGVVVASVRDRTPGAQLGLQGGDVIVSVNRQNIDNVAQLKGILAGGTGPWAITVRRDGKLIPVTVR